MILFLKYHIWSKALPLDFFRLKTDIIAVFCMCESILDHFGDYIEFEVPLYIKGALCNIFTDCKQAKKQSS